MIKGSAHQAVEDAQMFSLHRYFLWATNMHHLFTTALTEKGQLDLRAWTKESIKAFEYMSYWYAGLFVVVEGWRELKLDDLIPNQLLRSRNVDLLRRFRNSVFHYQTNFLDEQFLNMVSKG
jgi:hypothetical protein